MDAVTLIEQALISGTAVAAKDTATSAVRDAYEALRAVLRRRFTRHQLALDALDTGEFSSEPSAEWRGLISAALAQTGAGDDELLAVATDLLTLADPRGTMSGRYIVDARNARGIQVGGGNTQFNTFA